jgi:hypothetical protein
MVSSLERYKPVKLEGRPLVLTKESKLQVSRPRHIHSAIAGAKKYLKPELLQPLLGQLDGSVNVPEGGSVTLSRVFLNEYLQAFGSVPDIVVWSGSTDKTILKRLKLPNIRKILNLQAKGDKWGNFALTLEDMLKNNKIIHTINLGQVNKRGNMLGLA